jgi:hypothetical protein
MPSLCCFPLVLGFDPDVIITPSDIKFGEEFGAFDFVHDFGDKW